METLSYRLHFEALCGKYNLGHLIGVPETVSGGLLHQMFRMETNKAVYAVKALNPQIMKRETAMFNMIFSEKVANRALQQGINALPALPANGSSILEVDGQYFMLFPWKQGKALHAGVVDLVCCQEMGALLAKLHTADFTDLLTEALEKHAPKINSSLVDWQNYAHLGQLQSSEWLPLLNKNLNNLIQWELAAQRSTAALAHNQVISHGDLDPKNVLWNDRQEPLLIDWESAGPVNPTRELIEVALYWSGFEAGQMNKEAFLTFLYAYKSHGGIIRDSGEDALYCGFSGKLGWLEYNLKRSLGLESTNRSEMMLGASEAMSTLYALEGYASLIPTLNQWLEELGT